MAVAEEVKQWSAIRTLGISCRILIPKSCTFSLMQTMLRMPTGDDLILFFLHHLCADMPHQAITNKIQAGQFPVFENFQWLPDFCSRPLEPVVTEVTGSLMSFFLLFLTHALAP
jgi:hypothetical protein